MEWTLILILTSIIGFLFYRYGTKNHDFFVKLGLPHPKPSFLFGNLPIFRNKLSAPEFIQKYYEKYSNVKMYGIFNITVPTIIIRDPEIIKQLFVKEFDSFSDHKVMIDSNVDVLFGNSLVALEGQKWRDMRATLSPAFTGSKMRQMFELISVCGDNFAQHFVQEAAKTDKLEYEMKEVFRRFASDVIATSAFGLQVNSFKDKDNEFFAAGQKLTNFNSPLVMLKVAGIFVLPKLMQLLNIRLFDRQSSDFFSELITKSIQYRIEHKIFRPDMLNLLMQIKQGKLEQNNEVASTASQDGFATVEESHVGKAVVKREWSDDEIIAQCFLFFLAGFDTISSLLSFLAYEMALNPEIEDKLYKEVEEANRQLGGKLLTYDVLYSMKYMDMVVSETLRKWPANAMTDRVCLKDITYQDDDGFKIKIEKGVDCWIPIYGLHHDPKYFPNPDKFDPKRFSDENKHNINMNAYLPFGVGPRNCIGSRFALMEAKVLIFYLIRSFKLKTTEKTQIPLQLAKTMIGVNAEKGVWLELQLRHPVESSH